jgi:hypothetical protein
VLHALASNTKGFLSRDTCVSSTQLIRPIGAKTAYLHLETPKLQDVFLSETISVLTQNNVPGALASNIDVFLWRDACVSSTDLNRPTQKKTSVSIR